MNQCWVNSDASEKVRVFNHALVNMWSQNDEFGLIRSSNKISADGKGYHFQAEILNPSNGECNIEIGFTSKLLSFDESILRTNRRDRGFRDIPFSFGFSSKGSIYDSFGAERHSKSQEYSGGDVIGCYIDMTKGICCFTRNGIVQKKILQVKDKNIPLFPTILFHSNGVVVNSYVEEKNFDFDNEG